MLSELPLELQYKIGSSLDQTSLKNLNLVLQNNPLTELYQTRQTKILKDKLHNELVYLYWRTQFRDGHYSFFENVFLFNLDGMESIGLKIIKCLNPEIYKGYHFNVNLFFGKSHLAIRLFHIIDKYKGKVYGGEYMKGDNRYKCGCGREIYVRNLKAHLNSRFHNYEGSLDLKFYL